MMYVIMTLTGSLIVNVKGLTQVQSRVYSCLTQILPQQDFVRSVIYFRLSQLSISRLEKRYAAASDERDQATC